MEKKPSRQSAATYAVMIVCLLAAGLGAYGASKNPKDGRTTTESTSYTQPTNIPSQNVAANVPVSDVPYSETQIETEMQTETEAQKQYVLPMGNFITKDYSDGAVVYSNTMQDWRVHNGIDFGDNRGQSVLAAADGKVQSVTTDTLWGTVVTVDHGNGVVAKYCGLEKDSTPEVGAEVEKGVVLGKLGEIPVESKDGPHLHLEITVNGSRVDPLKFLQP